MTETAAPDGEGPDPEAFAAAVAEDWNASYAALDWQLDCGIDEVIGEAPVNRYEVVIEKPARAAQSETPARVQNARNAAGQNAAPQTYDPSPEPQIDPVAVASAIAASAATLEALETAIRGFDLCDLKRGARNTVFADGNPKARVLILGEAPGREEDIEGRPFVGEAGRLLDRMFGAIGLTRQSPDPAASFYITNVMPWRPEGNRDPSPAEIAMLRPFVERHIALADPDVIVVMGNTPLIALTGNRGILRARGTWTTALEKPLLPMTHPAYLLRTPAAKREAWADLLALRAFLDKA
ncbi:uracil-DNA glycosylase family protein [Paracoccus sp. IB05]|uniref:uracil-DNA glycosylase n=1 Tax=Paracoccus sp. IB05 TaxID=2779367 RepID=UPI0018E6DE50|nr:uracil-DNA glycosylase [Paracoccus sp. IB05]MBJ2152536.1 uracil-DNA glycosylase [Paracoccus sp. IB05]